MKVQMNSPYRNSIGERLKALVSVGLFAATFVVLLPWHIASEHHHDFPNETTGHCVGVSEEGTDDHERAHTFAEHDWSALPGSKSQNASDSLVLGVVAVESSFHLSWIQQGGINRGDSLRLRFPDLEVFRLRGPPLS